LSLEEAIRWQLPNWVDVFLENWESDFATKNTRVKFAAALALENVEQATGGPFGAAVFTVGNAELVAIGVNLVTTVNSSIAHAEMVALSFAQRRLNTFDLSSKGRFELVTSVEPCAMCLGAIPWSGVSRVLSGANAADAEAIGFDEGSKPASWTDSLRQRGIEVYTEIERRSCVRALEAYARSGGEVYNGHQGR